MAYYPVRCPICNKYVHIHENGKIKNVCDESHLDAIKGEYKDLLRKIRRSRVVAIMEKRKPVEVHLSSLFEGLEEGGE